MASSCHWPSAASRSLVETHRPTGLRLTPKSYLTVRPVSVRDRLRSKLGDEREEAAFIHTVWGVGYRFEVAA